MTDEVTRLRTLRRIALKARALAAVLHTAEERRDCVMARGARLCWRIARICSGRLAAHPYEAFQRGPKLLDTWHDGLDSLLAGSLARRMGRRAQYFQAQLKLVGQMLDDVRALTLSPDLSDDFGRAQTHMRQILSELSLRAALERGHAPQPVAHAAPSPDESRSAGSSYLAF